MIKETSRPVAGFLIGGLLLAAGPGAAISLSATPTFPASAIQALPVMMTVSADASPPPPLRNPSLYPLGYYPGDPMPPRTVYLTFDDGPCDFTGAIVDTLRQEGVHATFFINAYDRDNPYQVDMSKNFMRPYADVLRRLVADGNVIGNHTFSHQDLGALSPRGVSAQLGGLEVKLREVLGDQTPRVRLIRPPFGSPWLGNWGTNKQKTQVTAGLQDRGIVMMWTTGWDSGDSAEWVSGEWYNTKSTRYHPGGPKYQAKMQRELDRIFKRANGSDSGIILLHDVHPTSRDLLASLIQELKRRGYAFGTLEDYCVWRWGPDVFERYDKAAAERHQARLQNDKRQKD